jgi:hypothetical protein
MLLEFKKEGLRDFIFCNYALRHALCAMLFLISYFLISKAGGF